MCDDAGAVVYVGSTTRVTRNGSQSTSTIFERTLGWGNVWTVPFRDDTPIETVRRIEGLVTLLGACAKPRCCSLKGRSAMSRCECLVQAYSSAA